MKVLLFGYEFIIRKQRVFVPPPPKPPKPVKKVRPPKCPVMDKVSYSREDASLAEKKIQNPYVRKYKCEFCDFWHMTHKRQKNG